MNTVSGKAGALVFFRRKGEQVTRGYVKPTDARTRAQGAQRSSLSNIIRVYQSASGFFKSAFENKPSNQSDYNALLSRNLKNEPKIYLPKTMADNNGGVVAPYIISDGSLQAIIVTGIGVAARTNIAVGDTFVLDDTTTIGALAQAVLENNTFIEAGDQLSYLSLEQYSSSGFPRLRSRKYELRLDVQSEELVRTYMPSFALTVNGGFLGHGEYVYSGAFAWVISRRTASGLKVSRQQLIVTSDELYQSYTGTNAATRAASSYGDVKSIFLDPASMEVGQAVQPSALPSIASVKFGSVVLNDGVTKLQPLATTGTIPASYIQMTGSNLQELTKVHMRIGGKNEAGRVDAVQIDVPVTVQGDTVMFNTDAIDVQTIKTVTYMQIYNVGEELYDFRSPIDAEETDPLG